MERKLGVNATQRLALIKNQASALLWNGKIGERYNKIKSRSHDRPKITITLLLTTKLTDVWILQMPCQNIHLTANPKCFLQLIIPQPITHFAFGVLAEGKMRKLLMVSVMRKTLLSG